MVDIIAKVLIETAPLCAVDKLQGIDGDRRALGSPVHVVQVVEVTAQALVENVGSSQSEGAIAANRPSSSVNSTSLRWLVELELVVGSNVTSATDGVRQNTISQGNLETRVTLASNHGGSHGSGCRGGTRGRGLRLAVGDGAHSDNSARSSLWLAVGDGAHWLHGTC